MSMKFNVFKNVKKPTVDGISTFIISINTIPEIFKIRKFTSIVFQNVFLYFSYVFSLQVHFVISLYIPLLWHMYRATQVNSIIVLYSATIYLLLNTQEKCFRYSLRHMSYQFFHDMTQACISCTMSKRNNTKQKPLLLKYK